MNVESGLEHKCKNSRIDFSFLLFYILSQGEEKG